MGPDMARPRRVSPAGAAGAADVATTTTGVAVLDEPGKPKSMSRMDHAPLALVATATNKAFGAVVIDMPSDAFFTAIQEDAAVVAFFAARPGLALSTGGLPLGWTNQHARVRQRDGAGVWPLA